MRQVASQVASRRLASQLRAARRAGDGAEAARIVRQALAAFPEDHFWRSVLAGLRVGEGRPREALALAEAILREAPGHPGALAARGEALLALRRPAQAEASLEAAWRRRPGPHLAVLLVRAYAAGDVPRAVAFARLAVERFPGSLRLGVELGLALERAGRLREAEEAYREAAGAYAGGGDKAFADARRLRLRLRVAGFTTEAALAEVERVLRVPSRARNAENHALRGALLTDLDRHDEAADAFARAAALLPGRSRYTADRAYALRRAGRRSEAWPLLQRVLAACPGDVVALSAYVADARSLGWTRAARAFLRGVLARDPEQRHLWGWLRRLGRGRG